MLDLPVRWIWRFIYVKKYDSNVATGVNYGVASCLILCVISKRTSRELEEPKRILPLFKDEHLERAWTSRPSPNGSQCPLDMEIRQC